jgi:hypothetical protein
VTRSNRIAHSGDWVSTAMRAHGMRLLLPGSCAAAQQIENCASGMSIRDFHFMKHSPRLDTGAYFQRLLRHARKPRLLSGLVWKNLTYLLARRRPGQPHDRRTWNDLGRGLAGRGNCRSSPSRAPAREAQTDQDQVVEIPGFPVRETGDNRRVQVARQRFPASTVAPRQNAASIWVHDAFWSREP